MRFIKLKLNTHRNGMLTVVSGESIKRIYKKNKGVYTKKLNIGSFKTGVYTILKTEITKESIRKLELNRFKYMFTGTDSYFVDCMVINRDELSKEDKRLNRIVVDDVEYNIEELVKELCILGSQSLLDIGKQAVICDDFIKGVIIVITNELICFIIDTDFLMKSNFNRLYNKEIIIQLKMLELYSIARKFSYIE